MKIYFINRISFVALIISLNGLFSNGFFEKNRFNTLSYLIDQDSLRNKKLIKPFYQKTNFSLIRISSFAKIYKSIPDLRGNIIFYGKSNNFHYFIESTIVNDFYNQFILGSNYARSNISGRINNAFLKLYNSQISFQIGRAPIFWGLSSSSSIITSSYSITYDHIILQINLANFSFELLTGQLGSEKTVDGLHINRYIAGHRLCWNVSNGLSIGIGEQIIYTGLNRGIDLTYINPFVPYFFTALEGDDDRYEPYDNDNSILFAFSEYKLKSNTSIYTEMIIDDYQVDQTNIENSLGYKIGFKTKIKKNYTSILEWNKIDRWTYIHHGQYTSWQNRGHSLGFPYGPNSESIQIKLIGDLRKGIYFFFDLIYLKKGRTYLNTYWDNTPEYILNNSYKEYYFYQYSIIKKNKKGIIEMGWSFKPFPNTISFDNPLVPKNGSLFLKINLILDKLFAYDV